MDDDDDKLELSSDALGALKEFYAERDAQEQRYRDLQAAADSTGKLSMEMFAENWGASQFWYTDETAERIARVLLSDLHEESGVAVLCVPSVYIQLRNLLATGTYGSPRVCLLEYDDRFSVVEGFVHYDFNAPLSLPGELQGQFDRIICDGPYLNEDCQTKIAITARWLSKPYKSNTDQTSPAHVVVCTGAQVADTIFKVYTGVHRTSFEIKFTKNRLSNAFWCYATFECDEWKWAS